jgi:hypothetical protein
VDVGCAPEGIVPGYPADQPTSLNRDQRPAFLLGAAFSISSTTAILCGASQDAISKTLSTATPKTLAILKARDNEGT